MLALLWWPLAAVAAVAAGTGVVAWRRAHTAALSLAEIAEAVVDLRATDLATALGIVTPHNRVTPGIGHEITERLRKGA
ncbi:hypothetical protein [Streptomyces sp. WAC01526]|uniref:hypothetical protein n=1 Tax=Streptomyces sp. WAC01526 TaxID=2588709 RepID=UPI0011DFBC98|nr:hypothetical protein [Streptomyces sp. WAC01526]